MNEFESQKLSYQECLRAYFIIADISIKENDFLYEEDSLVRKKLRQHPLLQKLSNFSKERRDLKLSI